jgi:hypothetical protein
MNAAFMSLERVLKITRSYFRLLMWYVTGSMCRRAGEIVSRKDGGTQPGGRSLPPV